MNARSSLRRLLGGALLVFSATNAMASFHVMQIEQVIGGVDGDTAAQAVQLRMRGPGQTFVSQGRLVAFDAAGLNPLVIADMTTDVANGAAGDRILVASTGFLGKTSPNATPDFLMTNLIPVSYLAAGKLVWQDDSGSEILWSLSWGGSSYTGSNTGSSVNDADGNFGPPVPDALPSSAIQALRFSGAAGDLSTNNASDYAVISSPIVFTNNARSSFTLSGPLVTDIDGSGATDARDVQLVINAALGLDIGGFDADINTDGKADAVDIQLVINGALGLIP